MLSIQSDEARHMANGYGSVMALLADEDNLPSLNESSSGTSGIRTRRSTRSSAGRRSTARARSLELQGAVGGWVVDDFVGNYIDRLSQFGVKAPCRLAAAANDVTWSHQTLGQVLSAVWPLNFWRSDAMAPPDFEWFETHYPGCSSGLPGRPGGLSGACAPGRRA